MCFTVSSHLVLISIISFPMQTKSDNEEMTGIKESNELDEYLSQAVKKVWDPILWWWNHRNVYPRLSAMGFDYLSVPGKVLPLSNLESTLRADLVLAMSTLVEHVFLQGRQLLHFTRNRLSARFIWAFLCFGDWSHKDMVNTSDVVEAIHGKAKGKRATLMIQAVTKFSLHFILFVSWNFDVTDLWCTYGVWCSHTMV